MARKVDITDKLTFDGNPFIVIKGKELEVNADAPTVLRIMNLAADDPGPKEVAAIYNLIFPDKLNFSLIQESENFAQHKTSFGRGISNRVCGKRLRYSAHKRKNQLR